MYLYMHAFVSIDDTKVRRLGFSFHPKKDHIGYDGT